MVLAKLIINVVVPKLCAVQLSQIFCRLSSLNGLTIWDACLSEDVSNVVSQAHSVKVLRLWNCSRYFVRKRYRLFKKIHKTTNIACQSAVLVANHFDVSPGSSHKLEDAPPVSSSRKNADGLQITSNLYWRRRQNTYNNYIKTIIRKKKNKRHQKITKKIRQQNKKKNKKI